MCRRSSPWRRKNRASSTTPRPARAPRSTALLPEVPTMKEAGVAGVEVPLWYGLLAPKATPRAIVRTLATAVAGAAQSDEMRNKLAQDGAEPVGNSPEDFDRQLRDEVVRWAQVVKVSGAKAD